MNWKVFMGFHLTGIFQMQNHIFSYSDENFHFKKSENNCENNSDLFFEKQALGLKLFF